MKTRLVLIAATCGALAVAAPLTARTSAIPAGNLVQNPGAEDGPIAQFDTVSPPTGWETTGATSAWAYGTTQPPDRPGNDVAAAVGGGKGFFSGGLNANVSTASQAIDVSGAAAEIDANGVAATLSAYLGGYAASEDTARVDARFRGATGNALGSMAIGPVTRTDRAGKTALLLRTNTKPVPAGTRTILVVITMTMKEAPKNQGFADNVSLTLGRPAAGGGTGGGTAGGKATLVTTCKAKRITAFVKPAAGQKVTAVTFVVPRRPVVRDTKAPFNARFATKGLPATVVVRANVTSGGPAQKLAAKAKRC